MQRFNLSITCVEANGDDINEMVNRSRAITAETFKKHCKWREVAESLGYDTGNSKKEWIAD
jgi:hypothetical protein